MREPWKGKAQTGANDQRQTTMPPNVALTTPSQHSTIHVWYVSFMQRPLMFTGAARIIGVPKRYHLGHTRLSHSVFLCNVSPGILTARFKRKKNPHQVTR